MRTTNGIAAACVVLALCDCGADHLREGKKQFAKGDNARSVAEFTKHLEKEPRSAEALFFRGAAHSATKEYRKAVADFDEAVRLDPGNPETYWSRGYAHANLMRDDLAIADYTKALELGTKAKGVALILRAGAYFRTGKRDEAERDLKKALEIDPTDQRAVKGLEELRRAKADPAYDPRILANRPADEQPAFGGVEPTPAQKAVRDRFVETVLASAGSKERALDELLNMAWQHYHRRELPASMKRFNQAWLLDPESKEVFRGFAMILRAWGHEQESRAWERKSRPENDQPRS